MERGEKSRHHSQTPLSSLSGQEAGSGSRYLADWARHKVIHLNESEDHTFTLNLTVN